MTAVENLIEKLTKTLLFEYPTYINGKLMGKWNSGKYEGSRNLLPLRDALNKKAIISQILQAVGESMDELLKQWKEEVIYDDWEEGERPDHFKEWVKLQLTSVGEERKEK